MNKCVVCQEKTYNAKFCSQKCMGKYRSIHYIGKNNPLYGRKHSLKTRKLMSLKATGRIPSEETRKKLSIANTKPPHICEYCGGGYRLKSNGGKKYCSRKCSGLAYRKTKIPKICKHCKDVFFVKYKHRRQTFCGHSCMTTYRNLIDNPSKKLEVRKKMSKTKKEFYLKHPEKHPNSIFRRNRKTKIEKIVERILIKNNISYKYNSYVKTKNSWRFPDFLINGKIIIECDGEYWHKNKQREVERDIELKEAGFKVFHFKGKHIKKKTIFVEQKIKEIINEKTTINQKVAIQNPSAQQKLTYYSLWRKP